MSSAAANDEASESQTIAAAFAAEGLVLTTREREFIEELDKQHERTQQMYLDFMKEADKALQDIADDKKEWNEFAKKHKEEWEEHNAKGQKELAAWHSLERKLDDASTTMKVAAIIVKATPGPRNRHPLQ